MFAPSHSVTSLFFFKRPAPHRDLHSFPTRRSSDLGEEIIIDRAGTPVAKVVPLVRRANRTAVGSLAGQLDLSDRKSTRLNSSHTVISYAVFCLKKKKMVQRAENSCQSESVECPELA